MAGSAKPRLDLGRIVELLAAQALERFGHSCAAPFCSAVAISSSFFAG